MDPRWLGLIGGVLGLLGGALGTAFSLKDARGVRERAYLIRVAVGFWTFVLSFLLALWIIPPTLRWLILAAYLLALPALIRVVNRELGRIRREEGTDP